MGWGGSVEMESEQSLNGWLVGWDMRFPQLAHFLVPFLSDRLVGGSIGSGVHSYLLPSSTPDRLLGGSIGSGIYSNLLPSSASDRRWMVA